jgi:hypothetical protein
MPVIGDYLEGWATVDEAPEETLPLVGYEALEFLRERHGKRWVRLVGVFGSRGEFTTALVWLGRRGRHVPGAFVRDDEYAAVQWGEYHGATIYEADKAWERRADGWVQRDYIPEGAQSRGPDELFVWGEIQEVHRVNGYVVIESIDPPASNAPDGELPRRVFHINGVDGRRVGHGFRSLDVALLHCMCVRAALGRGTDYLNRSGDTMAAARVLRLAEALS